MRTFHTSVDPLSLREHRLIFDQPEAPRPPAPSAEAPANRPTEGADAQKSPEEQAAARMDRAQADVARLRGNVADIQRRIEDVRSQVRPGRRLGPDRQRKLNELQAEPRTAQEELAQKERDARQDQPKVARTVGEASMQEMNAAISDFKNARGPDGKLDTGKAFAAAMRLLAAVMATLKNIGQWNKPVDAAPKAAPGAGADGKGKEGAEAPTSVEKFQKYLKEGKAYEDQPIGPPSTYEKLEALQRKVIDGTSPGPKQKLDTSLATDGRRFAVAKSAADAALNNARVLPETTPAEKKTKADAIEDATKKVKEAEEKLKTHEEEKKKAQAELEAIKKEHDDLKSVIETKQNEAKGLKTKFDDLQSKLTIDPATLEDDTDRKALAALIFLANLTVKASDSLESPEVEKDIDRGQFNELKAALQKHGILTPTDGQSALGLQQKQTDPSKLTIEKPDVFLDAATKLHAKWVEKKPTA